MSNSKLSKPVRMLPWFMFFLCILFLAYDYFVQVAPNTLMAELLRDMSMHAKDLQIFSLSFFLSYALLQIPAGYLIDKFGVRWIMTIAVLVCGFGVLLFAMSQSLFLGSLSRVIVGGCSAFAFLGGLYIIAHWFKPKYFATMVGLLQMGSGLGSVIGAAPLIVLDHDMGWRSGLHIIGVLTLIFAILFCCFLRDKKNETKDGNAKSILKNPQLWLLALVNFATWTPAALVNSLWSIPGLLRAVGWPMFYTGEYFIIFWVAAGLLAPLIGWYVDRNHCRKGMLYFTLILGIIGSVDLLMLNISSAGLLVTTLFILGVPAGGQCIVFSLLKTHVGLKRYIFAASICNMASILSGVVVPFLMNSIVHSSAGAANSMAHYRFALAVVPIIMVVGLFIAIYGVKEHPV